ncbi:MAG: hypothetical protein QNK05_16270 [Myxococcota bacterium]|nr:hypothetical protein [Myxococcota bacterium]
MRIFLLAAIAALLLPAAAFAGGPFDGSKALVCSADDTVECSDGGTCLNGDAEDVGLPALIRVDAKKKTISGISGTGEGETAPIATIRKEEGRLVLQGGQAGRGFTMVVDSTGQSTISVSDSGYAFVVFGECAAL